MKKSKTLIVSTNRLVLLLRRIYLEGKMKAGCLIELEDGIGSTQAMDTDGSVFLSCSSRLADSSVKWVLGIGDLDLMIKFLSTVEEKKVSLKLERNRLTVHRPKHGSLKFLLTDADVVPTIVEDLNTTKKLVKQCKYSLIITESVRDDVVRYINMLGTRNVTLKFAKGLVTLRGGLDTDHQYSLTMGRTERGDSAEAFHLQFYGDTLVKVFDILEYGEKIKKPKLLFGEDKPIVVKQNKGNLWALLHSEEE